MSDEILAQTLKARGVRLMTVDAGQPGFVTYRAAVGDRTLAVTYKGRAPAASVLACVFRELARGYGVRTPGYPATAPPGER